MNINNLVCGDCAFGSTNEKFMGRTRCVRNPPQFAMLLMMAGNPLDPRSVKPQPVEFALYPEVHPDLPACGEFSQKQGILHG